MRRDHLASRRPWRATLPSWLVAAAGGALLLPTRAPAQQPAPRPSALVFAHVTVVDVQDGRLLPEQTVVVVKNRVQTVGPASAVRLPSGAQVVDAHGKYLIPGLWDMHVHVWDHPTAYTLYIATGITGVREMSTFLLDSMRQWRREIVRGTRVGPRVVGTGGFLTDHKSAAEVTPKLAVGVDTPEEARRAVDSLVAAGADFIKVRGGLTGDVFLAAAAAARRAGVFIAGHSQARTVGSAVSSDSGMHSIEHVWPGPDDCATVDSTHPKGWCPDLFTHLAHNNTWLTPTFGFGYLNFGSAAGGSQPYERSGLVEQLAAITLAGSDAGTPGLALHQELGFLVGAGLTPLEALRAATLNPAKYFSGTDSMGTVAPGKLADLVLLDADPLASIANSTKVQAVVADGRYYDRAALDRLMAEAKSRDSILFGAEAKPE